MIWPKPLPLLPKEGFGQCAAEMYAAQLYNEQEKILLSGDVLFRGSVGRTDLPGGNHETLINSIQQKLFVLPDDVVVYPGHGSTTTLGVEKISNPYCALSLR